MELVACLNWFLGYPHDSSLHHGEAILEGSFSQHVDMGWPGRTWVLLIGLSWWTVRARAGAGRGLQDLKSRPSTEASGRSAQLRKSCWNQRLHFVCRWIRLFLKKSSLRYVVRTDLLYLIFLFTSNIVWEGNCSTKNSSKCDLKLRSDVNVCIHPFPFLYIFLQMYFPFDFISFSVNDFSLLHVHVLYCSSWMEYLNLFVVTYTIVWGTKALFCQLCFGFCLPCALTCYPFLSNSFLWNTLPPSDFKSQVANRNTCYPCEQHSFSVLSLKLSVRLIIIQCIVENLQLPSTQQVFILQKFAMISCYCAFITEREVYSTCCVFGGLWYSPPLWLNPRQQLGPHTGYVPCPPAKWDGRDNQKARKHPWVEIRTV